MIAMSEKKKEPKKKVTLPYVQVRVPVRVAERIDLYCELTGLDRTSFLLSCTLRQLAKVGLWPTVEDNWQERVKELEI